MQKKHLLIVDDELMLLYSLKRMLDDKYIVTIAHGGRQAIDLIEDKNNHFDLIISDVSMPDINGVNLYLYIAKNSPGLEKHIIFMTGGPTSGYLDDFFTSNNAMCLSKPFEGNDLRDTISNFLATNPN